MSAKKQIIQASQFTWEATGAITVDFETKTDVEVNEGDFAQIPATETFWQMYIAGSGAYPSGHVSMEALPSGGAEEYENVYATRKYNTPQLQFGTSAVDDTNAVLDNSTRKLYLSAMDAAEFSAGILKVGISGQLNGLVIYAWKPVQPQGGGTSTVVALRAIVSGNGSLDFQLPFSVQRV